MSVEKKALNQLIIRFSAHDISPEHVNGLQHSLSEPPLSYDREDVELATWLYALLLPYIEGTITSFQSHHHSPKHLAEGALRSSDTPLLTAYCTLASEYKSTLNDVLESIEHSGPPGNLPPEQRELLLRLINYFRSLKFNHLENYLTAGFNTATYTNLSLLYVFPKVWFLEHDSFPTLNDIDAALPSIFRLSTRFAGLHLNQFANDDLIFGLHPVYVKAEKYQLENNDLVLNNRDDSSNPAPNNSPHLGCPALRKLHLPQPALKIHFDKVAQDTIAIYSHLYPHFEPSQFEIY